jgi:hypothetical protein
LQALTKYVGEFGPSQKKVVTASDLVLVCGVHLMIRSMGLMICILLDGAQVFLAASIFWLPNALYILLMVRLIVWTSSNLMHRLSRAGISDLLAIRCSSTHLLSCPPTGLLQ